MRHLRYRCLVYWNFLSFLSCFFPLSSLKTLLLMEPRLCPVLFSPKGTRKTSDCCAVHTVGRLPGSLFSCSALFFHSLFTAPSVKANRDKYWEVSMEWWWAAQLQWGSATGTTRNGYGRIWNLIVYWRLPSIYQGSCIPSAVSIRLDLLDPLCMPLTMPEGGRSMFAGRREEEEEEVVAVTSGGAETFSRRGKDES